MIQLGVVIFVVVLMIPSIAFGSSLEFLSTILARA